VEFIGFQMDMLFAVLYGAELQTAQLKTAQRVCEGREVGGGWGWRGGGKRGYDYHQHKFKAILHKYIF
jgi:hypothetical protein